MKTLMTTMSGIGESSMMMDWNITTAYPKPLCILFCDTKGIQWADTDASDVYGPLQTHVYGRDESKGVMGTPFDSLLNRLFTPRTLYPKSEPSPQRTKCGCSTLQ